MNQEFYVQYNSNDLLDDICRVKKIIIDRYEADYKEAVDNANAREKRGILYKLWFGNLWYRCYEIRSSFERKMKRCYGLEHAALVGESVSISNETLKWINDHFGNDWCW